MRVALELFAGSGSFEKVAKQYGYTTISSDIMHFSNIDIVGDVLELPIEIFTRYNPDLIWASPPCTTFSIAGARFHYKNDNGTVYPYSEAAFKGIEILEKTIEIIKACNPKYFFIENPRGLMRKMPCMKEFERATVWYCRYGDNRAKPTDIWTNNLVSLFNPDGWQPRRECFNGNEKCHHDKCPRGTNNGLGTQGLKNNFERSKIPPLLIEEIIKSTL